MTKAQPNKPVAASGVPGVQARAAAAGERGRSAAEAMVRRVRLTTDYEGGVRWSEWCRWL
jgi:hypothetical protein